jgi:preprotein translocase subunit YajC
MHAFLALLAATTSTTTKSSKSSNSSYVTLLFILVLFGAAYVFFIRPRQQRMRQQQTAARELTIGDQVVTAGGIQGRLVAIDSDVAEVEVAPGVVLTFLRRAVNPVNPRAGGSGASTATPPEDRWPYQRGQAAPSSDNDTPDDKPDQHP